MGTLLKAVGAVVGLVVLLVGVVAVGYLVGVFGAPTGGLVDAGEWGNVTENETEVVTTIWVNNPNPIGLTLGSVSADYRLSMNDVQVAEGTKEGVSIPKGNNTVELRTYVQNHRLPAWWVEYVRAEETIEFSGSATIDAGLLGASATVDLPSRTFMRDQQPVIGTLSSAVQRTEGTYTEGVTSPVGSVTAGYEVRDGSATWGSVNETNTTALLHFEVHNAGDVALPATPDGLEAEVSMNDVAIFDVEGEDFEVRRGGDVVLEPGETERVTLAILMDNRKVDDWFQSHVRRDEVTDLETSMRMTVGVPDTDATISVPAQGADTYECTLRTGILVDGQATGTDCGQADSVAP